MPLLVNEGGGLVCESVGKADLLSDHFDSKQSREAVDLPLTCHPSPSLTTFAIRLRQVRRLLLDLVPYGGTDPLDMFPLFLKRTADVMASCLSVVFRLLVRLGCFPNCWRQANVTKIGKVSVAVMNFCACPIHCKVHWRVGRRLGSCRLISVQPLIWLTIGAFFIGSAL